MVENGTESQAQPSGINALRNSLLPDGALSARFQTTIGQDAKALDGILYVGSYRGEEQRVLWWKLDDKFVPSGTASNITYKRQG